MFLLSNFLEALANIVDILLRLYMWIIIARALISWVNLDPSNPIVRFLYSFTEPILYRIRHALPIYLGGIDFSPIIVFLIIIFLQHFLVQSLYDLARSISYMS